MTNLSTYKIFRFAIVSNRDEKLYKINPWSTKSEKFNDFLEITNDNPVRLIFSQCDMGRLP